MSKESIHYDRVVKLDRLISEWELRINEISKGTIYQVERILEKLWENLFKNDKAWYTIKSQSLYEKSVMIEKRKRQLEK